MKPHLCAWLAASSIVAAAACGGDSPSHGHGANGAGAETGAGNGMGMGGAGAGASLVLSASALAVAGQVAVLGGVQGGPRPVVEGGPDLTGAYQMAGIPLVRGFQGDGFAGCSGGSGRRLTLGDVFPDRKAPVDDPASYRFEDADAYLQSIVEAGAEPLFEAGYDIGCESNAMTAGGQQEGSAPLDVKAWVSVVQHVLAHFNDGWADGHALDVSWVEFPNDPCALGGFDCTKNGTGALFTALGAFAAGIRAYNQAHGRHVRAIGPGLAIADALESVDDLAAALKQADVTLDGYSYHDLDAPEPMRARARQLRGKLDAAGLSGVPLVASAWNWPATAPLPAPAQTDAAHESAFYLAHNLQTRTLLQGIWDEAVVYRMGPGEAGAATPYFAGSGAPRPAYFGWLILDDLAHHTPVRLEASYPAQSPTLLAARDEASQALGLVVSHFCAADTDDCPAIPAYALSIYDLPAKASFSYERYVVDRKTAAFTPAATGQVTTGNDGTLELSGAIDRWTVDYWKLAAP